MREKQNAFDQEIARKNTAFAPEQALANKYRFAIGLRERPSCHYDLQIGPHAASTTAFWQELLTLGGWVGHPRAPPLTLQYGVTIRVPSNSPASTQCAAVLQRKLDDLYSNPPTKAVNNQQSEYLDACNTHDCLQIEIDY